MRPADVTGRGACAVLPLLKAARAQDSASPTGHTGKRNSVSGMVAGLRFGVQAWWFSAT